MKVGKLNWDDLSSILDKNKGMTRDEVKLANGIGEDCAILDFGEYDCVISTDPITGADNNIGKLAVNINCNDIAACGVEPLALMVTILAPQGCKLKEIESIMNEIDKEAKKLRVEIIGGHTEVTSAVNKIVVSCTVLGKCKSNSGITTSGAKVGNDIIVTKSLGLEGTTILIADNIERCKKFLSSKEIEEGLSYSNEISVVKEGIISGEFGVCAMHDITEGGVLGAVWELATAADVGFYLFEDKMPIREVTKKVCKEFSINPLGLVSSGSMLIATDDGDELIKILKKSGVDASLVGKITEEKGIIYSNGKNIEVRPPKRDELFNIK
ncbi:AIR synthase family protein [Clostridium fallax]|uniref:Hydrogenase maturation protein, carbamoyl dehydratase HypE n=1 Tax=Clostridium fallax TaxID=1533 RepID=A0A1M4YWE9_9CLOT|nr:AIR synthase family protein [Clostridium fallax]SHF10123.1 Hydrogenase maturation protein, carbamoyl dehydratase HypE [Clostridium fallax]SQB22268.1 hydrogenase maturation factor [Clostridium fallax]